jgi:hypothetical protein
VAENQCAKCDLVCNGTFSCKFNVRKSPKSRLRLTFA